MRKVFLRSACFGALGTLTILAGCASVESVETAQKTADHAVSTANAAQTSAGEAHQAAGAAMATAQPAQQGAEKANAGVADLNGQVAALQALHRKVNETDFPISWDPRPPL